MFENLSDKLDRAFKVLKGQGRITEINVAETLKEVRKALLDADVNYKVAKQFTDTVKEKALGENVLTAVSPGQLMIKIAHDELAKLMGGEKAELDLKSSPTVILMSGLQGSGKTTLSGKLANFLKLKRQKHPLLVACDVYRPAAIDQLKVLGEQIEVPVFSEEGNTNPVDIAKKVFEDLVKYGTVQKAILGANVVEYDYTTAKKDDLDVNGKSIMGVMMLAAEHGSTIVLRAEGPDADAALDALSTLVSNKFGER